jgi:hypothetical protein
MLCLNKNKNLGFRWCVVVYNSLSFERQFNFVAGEVLIGIVATILADRSVVSHRYCRITSG